MKFKVTYKLDQIENTFMLEGTLIECVNRFTKEKQKRGIKETDYCVCDLIEKKDLKNER